jgi:serine/threonine-protein kinase
VPFHPLVIGRYVLFDEIASGGMATVHFGRMLGPGGFARTVAIKRLHPQYAKDPEFVSMFLDEARLVGRIRDLHVVPTLDVVANDGELLLVMEYVQGVSLSYLVRVARRRNEPVPVSHAVGVIVDALLGLHAAHQTTSDSGEPLEVVHRDVSPQNILVGIDGVVRVVDFGIAKAAGRLQTTRDGQIKGKAGYMAPEQIRGGDVDRRTDVFAASVVLWELLTGQRLFASDTAMGAMNQVFEKVVPRPSQVLASIPQSLDAIVLRGLARAPAARYASAKELADALEAAVEVAPPRRLAPWVEELAADVLAKRAERIVEIESSTSDAAPAVPTPAPALAAAPPLAPAPAPAPAQAQAQVSALAAAPAPSVHIAEGPRSEVVSVQDIPVRRRSQRVLAVSLVASLVATAALGSLLLFRMQGAGPAVATPPSAPPATPADVASSANAAAAAPTAPPPASAPAPSSANVPPSPLSPTTPRGVTKRARPQPNRPDSCTPPYTVDADGTRHWKHGC